MKDIDTFLVIQGISYHYSSIYYNDVIIIMDVITIISLHQTVTKKKLINFINEHQQQEVHHLILLYIPYICHRGIPKKEDEVDRDYHHRVDCEFFMSKYSSLSLNVEKKEASLYIFQYSIYMFTHTSKCIYYLWIYIIIVYYSIPFS